MNATARRWGSLAVLSCALGMACKETMVTAPVMVAVFDRIFLFESFREAWRARRWLYIGLATTWLLLAALLATGPRPHSAGFSSGLSPWVYLLNQPPVLMRYLQQVFWPSRLVLLYGWPRQVGFAEVWPYGLVIVALLALTVATLRWRPRLGFLGAWFWITLAPTSTIVPIATEVAAERRMYLPLASLAVLVVVGLARLWETFKDRMPRGLVSTQVVPITAALLLATVSVALASATIGRNQEYASPVTMARTVLERYPTPVAHLSLGRALLDAGERHEGLKQLRLALPGAPGAHLTLGLELIADGRLGEGVVELQTFVRDARPFLADVIVARASMGQVFLQQERWAEAAQQFRLILDTLPGNPVAEQHLADALFSLNQWEEAIVHYREYLSHEPRDAGALNNLGIAFGSSGQFDEARAAFLRAVEAEPDNGPAHHNLASVLLRDLDFDNALLHAQRAVAIQPGDAGSRELLGQVLLTYGRLADAEAQFARALALNPESTFARDELKMLRHVQRPSATSW